MPLPANGTAWPPVELKNITPNMDSWSAWWAGDTSSLEALYGYARTGPPDRPAQYRGGLIGGAARFFWGAPRGDLTIPKSKLHVPIAADICQASADLLFSEPPTLVVEQAELQKRLDLLSGDGLHTTLAEAAEICAAQGGVYLRTTWDREVSDRPFLTYVHADNALPTFRWGRLVAVTFWTIVRRQDNRVWRHLERHEVGSDGVGYIFHGLYEGTPNALGRTVPLNEDQATAGLAEIVDSDSKISTFSPGLAVQYVRNQGPQRTMRLDPLGRSYGRSDLDGVEPLMDALDETYTSWMRDIRLGKARVFVAASLLDVNGPGAGTAWDADREVYAPLNALATRADSSMPIEAQQFAIRYAEHQATAEQWIGDILRSAGYSAQTFGEKSESVGVTATEVQSRERRSFMTRERKVRQWRPALSAAVEKLLAVDAAVFRSGLAPQAPTVEFSDSVQDSMLTLANTADAMRRARAASTETVVGLLHPEWDAQQIADEVALITSENALPELA